MENVFASLISLIGVVFESCCTIYGRPRYGVGGLLADNKYAVTGITDNGYDADDVPKLIMEQKTGKTFQEGERWYRKSRGVQVFGALYWEGVPAMLATQSQYKLLVESPNRDRVYVFPATADDAHQTGRTASDEFLAVLTLCLISTRQPMSHKNMHIKPKVFTPIKSGKIRVV